MTGTPDSSLRNLAEAARAEYRRAVTGLGSVLGPTWSSWTTPAGRWSWAWFGRSSLALPDQGWKLHVSTTPDAAARLVGDVLPRLAAHDVWWKLPDDLRGVVAMTSGEGGSDQVGKVVTVYPATEAVLVEVVELLDSLWRPAVAPRVPRDLSVGSGGALFLRYGVMLGRATLLDPTGRPASALRAPHGDLVADRRDILPDWARVPPALTVGEPSGPPSRLVEVAGRRFALLRRLASRAGATVDAAVDAGALEVALVRRATPGVGADELGRDATVRLANEARVLTCLGGAHGTPEVVAHDPVAHVLVTRDVGGRSLDHLAPADGLSALVGAAERLAGLHARGMVHRDVKPTNLLWDGRQTHLVDLELAADLHDPGPLVGGTSGYLPPGADRSPVDPGVDVYALGGCLTSVLLGSCPSRLPRADNRERQLGLLVLRGLTRGADLVGRLTSPSPERPTAREAARLLADGGPSLLTELEVPPPPPPATDRSWALDTAHATAGAARAFAEPAPAGTPRAWRNAHHFPAHRMQGINLGAAGIVLGLTTIDECRASEDLAEDALAGAYWLTGLPPYEQAHGLFTGNAGVAVALAVAGVRHGDPGLVRAARSRLVAATSGVGPDPDLFSGAAGVVLAALHVSAVLDDEGPLDLVGHALDVLRAGCEPAVDDGPTSYGAAHGLAGLALACTRWSSTTGDALFATLGEQITARLSAEVVGDGGDVRAADDGRTSSVGAWCHGLMGHAWCLAQSTRAPGDEVPTHHRWAIDPVLAAPVPFGDPTLCHGTAGALETYRVLGALDRAAEAAAVLRLTRQTSGVGGVWSAEHPDTITPDLWVGFLGPATQLAMLAAGAGEPLLSEAWLRRCSRQG